MGRTKAIVDVDGAPMASRVAAALRAGGCRDVVLIGGDVDELKPLGMAVVADLHPGEGPLGGILTALHHFRAASHVVVAACDLPMLDGATVAALIDEVNAQPSAAAVVARTDRIEPTLAVWNADARETVQREFDAGERAVLAVLDVVDSVVVTVAPTALLNVNRPGDVPNSTSPAQ